MTNFDALRLQRGSQHLHLLGQRAIAEFIVEIAEGRGGAQVALDLPIEHQSRLTPAILATTCGDSFPPCTLRAVPAGERA